MSINYSLLRNEMVDELERLGITNTEVLDAMRQVPRHKFMETAFEFNAYDNQAWTIGNGQTISQPYIVARMTEIVAEAKREKILELGTGSGYQAAVLSLLFEQVYTVERIGDLHTRSQRLLEQQLGYHNIYCCLGDGTMGWPEQKYHPFNAIICTAAATRVLPELFKQLDDPGILVMPIGLDATTQFLYAYYKENGQIREQQLEQVSFVPVIEGVKK